MAIKRPKKVAPFSKVFDFGEYKVEVTHLNLMYETPHKKMYPEIRGMFNWIDSDKDGSGVHITMNTRFGSRMEFHQWEPDDLKTVFDFIGRGNRILPRLLEP